MTANPTIVAFEDHGRPAETATTVGIDTAAVGRDLIGQGVAAFDRVSRDLFARLEGKTTAVSRS